MSTTHLYSQFGTTDWSTPAKARNVWVMGTDGLWHPLSNQWSYDGSTWQRGFTTTPGPLVEVVIQYDSLSCNAGDSLNFSVIGEDADGLGISLSGDSITWTVTTETESISPTGDGTTATMTAGFPGGHTTQVNVSVIHSGTTWSDTVTVTIN